MHQTGSRLDVRLVDSIEAFAALRPAWQRLCERSARTSVFYSHEWLDAAWQWCGLGAEMYVLCCERGDDLLGAAALVRARAPGRTWAARTLEFLAVPDTQWCDVLAVAGEEAAVAEALSQELLRRRHEWDSMCLRYLDDEATTSTTLCRALRGRGLRCALEAATANPSVVLDSGWDRYYGTRTRRLKKANNLAANRVAKAGVIELAWLAPGTGTLSETSAIVDAITDISARSWKKETENALDRAGPQAFVRRLARHAHERGWLSVWTLRIDGKPVAMELQLVDRGAVYALRSDFDAGFETMSPGTFLSHRLLERLFASGLRRYSMGPGENAYKYRWAETTERVSTLSVYSPAWRGRMLGAWELAIKPKLKALRDRRRARTAATPAADADAGAEVAS